MKWFDFWIRSPSSSLVVSWRELTIFSAYRVFLAVMLFATFYLELPPSFLGQSNPVLYLTISLLYLLIALVWLVSSFSKWGGFNFQTQIQLLSDIVFITLLVHFSGGLQTGLGTLLVVVVVTGGTLTPGRISLFIAAMAALSVLLEVSYSQFTGDGVTRYSHAGMLGATFFVTALLAQTLSKKMKLSQVLVEKHSQNAAKSAALNEHIISSMQTGVLVVDEYGVVRLSNQSARKLLGLNQQSTGRFLADTVPALSKQLTMWRNHNKAAFETVQIRPDLPEIHARATVLTNGETLIYLDNTSALAQQAQQLKLASLGRLAASIAHEIRNPLGAISHASELLAESHNNDAVSSKLTDIIQRHSARVNGIIETILEMSRRKVVKPTVVALAPWIKEFIIEFCEFKHVQQHNFKLVISSSLASINMDPEQLHQVMWNLVENAWHYSDKTSPIKPPVQVHLYHQYNEVVIDIRDNGKGVTDKMQQYLFEPFHSDRTGGTGLGLYLARELCQANGARLNYLPGQPERCFRISFPLVNQRTLQ
ncbi:MAG: two-component system sensor histidine kinase PilS (NtrC family) [Methylophagaceae bacterium]|jgi:two-component system sensor histidine kinase PilS (NtrC family)